MSTARLPTLKELAELPCEGCDADCADDPREWSPGPKICRSCYLLNKHISENPGCAACVVGTCPYVQGDAVE